MGKVLITSQKNIEEMAKDAPAKTSKTYSRAPVRLWVKARFLSYRRSRDVLHPKQHLVKLENVNDRKSLRTYHGKRVAYVYKAHTEVNKTRYRVSWGKIARAHGDNGLALVKFKKNLPPRAIGDALRVFLYPQRGQTVQHA